MRRGALFVLTCLALAGCSGDGSGPEKAPTGVSAGLFQFRQDEVAHRMQIGLRNDGAAGLYVRDVQLVTESFAKVPPTKIDSEIPRTPRVDLPIPFGAARCDARKVPDAKPASVIAHLRRGGEKKLRKVRLPVKHPDPLLTKLVRSECGTYLARKSADARFGESPWQWLKTSDGLALRSEVMIKRTGAGKPVTLMAVNGNPHYNVRLLDRRLPYALPAGTGDLRLPVHITPARCDPHSFAERKYAHRYSVTVKLADEGPYTLPFESAGQLRASIDKYARKACGI